MPYQIIQKNNKYKLFNLAKQQFVKVDYKSRDSAINAGKRFMEYRKEKPVVKGDRIVDSRRTGKY